MSKVYQSPSKRVESTAVATVSFESATAEIVARKRPVKERMVLYTLAALLVTIFVFISVVKLDRVVTAQGRVVPVGGALTVQPLDKSIISRVLVSAGDVVKKGQVLAICDPTFVHADLTAMQEKVANLEAQQRRIELEEAGKPFRRDPSKSYDQLQGTISQQRSAEFSAGIKDFDERIHASEAQITGFKESIKGIQDRVKIAKETEDMYTKMEKAGVATRLDLIGIQDKSLDMMNQLGTQQTGLDSAQHALASLKEQRSVFVQKWHDDDLVGLTSVRGDYEQAVNDLEKAKKMSDLVDLQSPVDAVVLKVPNLSTGGVAMDAEPLFSLMPLNAPMQIVAEIDSQDTGFVRVGDRATIKFTAFKFLEHGTGDGVVKTISQDSFTESDDQDTVSKSTTRQSKAPFYEARIAITGLHLRDVPPGTQVIPGMTLDADIIVGKRTILWYLFGGALRSGADAMHEP